MNRQLSLKALSDASKIWDILVIGGGASGLGIAVDAAKRGHKTLLIDRGDFASGTSSRSTKLVHGGVRYLKAGQIKLVLSALKERGYLLKNAPHLVHGLNFIIPCYAWWEKPFYAIGLSLYDYLAGKRGINRTRILSNFATQTTSPGLCAEGLRGGILYADGQFDDSRLAIDLAATANRLGAQLVNYAELLTFVHEESRLKAAFIRDRETGQEYCVRAKTIINATGVYSDQIRRLDDPQAKPMVSLSQGAHLVLPRFFFPRDTALMIPSTSDGRVLFAIPWHKHVLLGTTDTATQDYSDEPRPLEQEVDYLLTHAAKYLSKAPTRSDVLSAFAGLRPLVKHAGVKSTAKLSRDHSVVISKYGLISLTGGKWTSYRAMAEDTVNQAEKVGKLPRRPCMTQSLKIYGAQNEHALRKAVLVQEEPELAEPLIEGLPYTAADIVYAAKYEMARSVADCLSRRTRILLLEAKRSLEIAPLVAKLLAKCLNKDEAWEQSQVEAYAKLAEGYILEDLENTL